MMLTRFLSNCLSPIIQWILVVAFLHIAATNSHAQKMIPDEWVNKWREYEIFSRSLKGTAESTTIGLVSGKSQTDTWSYKQNQRCVMMCSSFGDKNPSVEYCLFANPHYAAEIQRNRADPNNVVLRDRKRNPNAILSHTTLPLFDAVFRESSPHFTYCNKRLSEVVKKPSFRVDSIANEALDGEELIRIEHSYVFDKPRKGSNIQSQRKGSIYFDPSRCWCIRRIKETEIYLVNGKRDHDTKWDVRYEVIDHPSGFPIIKTQIVHTTGAKNRNGVEQEHGAKITVDYQLIVDDRVPDSDFKLSAFGLPEPRESGKSRIYLWGFAASASCLALSLLFRYLARRRRRLASAK